MTLPTADGSEIKRFSSAEFDVVATQGAGLRSFSITAYPGANGGGRSVFEKVAGFIRKERATVVSQRVFGCRGVELDGLRPTGGSDKNIGWPITLLCGNGNCDSTSTGSHLQAISGNQVKPVLLNGRTVGSLFEDDAAYYCLLGNLQPKDLSASRPEQAKSVFEGIESALGIADMSVSHIIRTWFFIDNILDWYPDFNKVRTRFFMDHGLFDGVVPASTGVGAANADGAALVTDVLAVKPKSYKMDMRPESYKINLQDVASPLQCSAMNYKSSFCRAAELRVRGQRRLYVSGTASITPDGRTAHVDDVEKQIDLTMQVVEGILQSREMGWSNVTRGVAYFKDIKNRHLLSEYMREKRLPAVPMAVSGADICRDDLLFEVEVDALASK